LTSFTDVLGLIASFTPNNTGFVLSAIEHMLSVKQREDVEARLANYNIPFQILQMVAEQCECAIETRSTRKELALKPKLSLLLARLNDRAIILLQQIFLDCHDSLSTFRFTVFLSSRYSPMMHKFVIDGKISGKSNSEYTFDVCIYSRRTGDLIAVGMQNKNTKQQGSDSSSLSKFLAIIDDVSSAHTQLHGAYYSSSYGYQPLSIARKNAIRKKNACKKMEIKFFEYKDKMYVENKSLSNP
jgi:anion-transporting  ArsA/GET3 family ATPase